MRQKICLLAGLLALSSTAWAYEDGVSEWTSSKNASSGSKKSGSGTSKASSAAKKGASKAKNKYSQVVNDKLDAGTLGVKFSMNWAWMSSDYDYTELNTGFSLKVGLAYDSSLFGPLGYRIEGLYVRDAMNYQGHEKGPFGNTDYDILSSYFEVPLMLTLRYQIVPRVTAYGTFGGYLAYNISNELREDGKTKLKKRYHNSVDEDRDFNDAWKWFDYGINFGFGAFIPITKSLLASAEMRFVFGLADREDHTKTKTDEDYPMNKRNVMFTLGLHF